MRLLRQVEPFGPYIDVSAMFWTKQTLVTPEGRYCIIMAVAGAIRLLRQSRSSSLSENSLLLCNIDRPSYPRLIDATDGERKYREAFFFVQLGFTLFVVRCPPGQLLEMVQVQVEALFHSPQMRDVALPPTLSNSVT